MKFFYCKYVFSNTRLEYKEPLKKCRHTTKLTYTPSNRE